MKLMWIFVRMAVQWHCPRLGCDGQKETRNDLIRPECPKCGCPMTKS